jgi:hypothetical protein
MLISHQMLVSPPDLLIFADEVLDAAAQQAQQRLHLLLYILLYFLLYFLLYCAEALLYISAFVASLGALLRFTQCFCSFTWCFT